MKGPLSGEGGGFNFTDNLFYLSLHCLDSKSGVQYARTRVSRELLDAWLSKKISFNGVKFDDTSVVLTDQDLGSGRFCFFHRAFKHIRPGFFRFI